MPPRRTFTGKASPTDPAAPAAADPATVEAAVPPPEPASATNPPPGETALPAPPPPLPSIGRPRRGRTGLWIGAILIAVGIIFLLNNVGLLWWWRWDVFWPLVVIALGVYLIVRRFR